MSKNITFDNFFISTEIVFKGCKTPNRKSDFVSESGSRYWYGENKKGKYVIRCSDHWVGVRKLGENKVYKNIETISSCLWHIKTNDVSKVKFNNNRAYFVWKVSGKSYLKDFKKI